MSGMTISAERRQLFNGTVLLNYLAGKNLALDVLLPGSLGNLEPILNWLLTRELVEINEQNFYQVSTLGHATVAAFGKRYRRILQYFDVFSAVDLESGDFALAHHSEFQTDAAWSGFLNENRWEDLRVAVAIHLEADPVELVFAHFMKEGRFGFEDGGWEISLLEGTVWNEIEEICASSLTANDLSYGDVSGEEVLSDVTEQGFLLARELSDHDPEVISHLARWAPSRQASESAPDGSMQPFWKTRWTLDVA